MSSRCRESSIPEFMKALLMLIQTAFSCVQYCCRERRPYENVPCSGATDTWVTIIRLHNFSANRKRRHAQTILELNSYKFLKLVAIRYRWFILQFQSTRAHNLLCVRGTEKSYKLINSFYDEFLFAVLIRVKFSSSRCGYGTGWSGDDSGLSLWSSHRNASTCGSCNCDLWMSRRCKKQRRWCQNFYSRLAYQYRVIQNFLRNYGTCWGTLNYRWFWGSSFNQLSKVDYNNIFSWPLPPCPLKIWLFMYVNVAQCGRFQPVFTCALRERAFFPGVIVAINFTLDKIHLYFALIHNELFQE